MTSSVPMKAIRGATTVERNETSDMLEATEELLSEIMSRNGLSNGRIVSIIFTATEDLTAVFPAKAARQIGLDDVPLLCCRELSIDGALPRCIRVLVHAWMNDRAPSHVYLRDAVSLRKDLAN